MIFGNYLPSDLWEPAALRIFRFSICQSLHPQVPIPSDFLGMMPYIATIVVLAGVVGKIHAPAEEGKAYEKESFRIEVK